MTKGFAFGHESVALDIHMMCTVEAVHCIFLREVMWLEVLFLYIEGFCRVTQISSEGERQNFEYQ